MAMPRAMEIISWSSSGVRRDKVFTAATVVASRRLVEAKSAELCANLAYLSDSEQKLGRIFAVLMPPELVGK